MEIIINPKQKCCKNCKNWEIEETKEPYIKCTITEEWKRYDHFCDFYEEFEDYKLGASNGM